MRMVTSQAGTWPRQRHLMHSLPVFDIVDGLRESQCPEQKDHGCKNDQIPVDPAAERDLLLQLDPYKSMGPKGIHPRILKELADIITRPLLIIFEQSW
ncbi:hypothetical protein HGM15179_019254 [Zosterops borbonicus]|uniref:Uncharacterized protein n=1 Tax=Zosterops borbonicus TaxID=364589 RepID=A0A8K1FXP6_9PASS|nr:hypothetical protein HGM15179_019254 [Zosterops borbonicus]